MLILIDALVGVLEKLLFDTKPRRSPEECGDIGEQHDARLPNGGPCR